MIEEMAAKSTVQKRGEAPLFMKQEGEGKGRKHLGLNIVVLSGAADKSQEIQNVRTDNLPLQFYTPDPKQKLLCEVPGWRPAWLLREGHRPPFHLTAVQCER